MGIWNSDIDNAGPASMGIGSSITSSLMDMLTVDTIVPGTEPGYQICKTILTDHPLGAVLCTTPCALAQSQKREIQIQGSPERELKEAFDKEWESLKADQNIRNTHTLSRAYGIASLVAIGEKDDADKPLDIKELAKGDITFNVLDPLNTAGSLVLNQNPNSKDFMKPDDVRVSGKKYHPSRCVVMMNEQPIYIQFTTSAFGFVGRSVFQRILFPLKSYIQTMLTDDFIAIKAGLLVAKMQSPGSIIDNRMKSFFGLKRQAIKGARTGNVVSIGTEEDVASLDLHNIKDAAEFSRNNILKNIASGADMPACIINKETLTEGFGEGSEDAKTVARFVDGIRMELAPIYKFFDSITMHRAWSPEFYTTMQAKYPDDYGDVPYETAFYQWKNAFIATWPNLLQEPDSEKSKTDDIILKAAIAVYEVLSPSIDPENRAKVATWLADVVNARKLLFDSQLVLDEEAIAAYIPPEPLKEPEPRPESGMV